MRDAVSVDETFSNIALCFNRLYVFFLSHLYLSSSGPKRKKLQNHKNFLKEHWHQRSDPPYFLRVPRARSHGCRLRGIQRPIWVHDQLWWVQPRHFCSACLDDISALQRQIGFDASSVMPIYEKSCNDSIFYERVSVTVESLIKTTVVNKRWMILCSSTWLAIWVAAIIQNAMSLSGSASWGLTSMGLYSIWYWSNMIFRWKVLIATFCFL